MPAEIVRRFDGWEERTFTCPRCGWAGKPGEMWSEAHRELRDFSCAKCETMLLIVPYPTHEEVREAVARGVPEAVALLPHVEQRERFDEACERMELKSADRLPDLDGEDVAADEATAVEDEVAG